MWRVPRGPAEDLFFPPTLSLPQSHSHFCSPNAGVCPWSPDASLQPRLVFSGPGPHIWLLYCYWERDSRIPQIWIPQAGLVIYVPLGCQACLSALPTTLSPPFSLSPISTLLSQPQTYYQSLLNSPPSPFQSVLASSPISQLSLRFKPHLCSQTAQHNVPSSPRRSAPSWTPLLLCSQSALWKMPVQAYYLTLLCSQWEAPTPQHMLWGSDQPSASPCSSHTGHHFVPERSLPFPPPGLLYASLPAGITLLPCPLQMLSFTSLQVSSTHPLFKSFTHLHSPQPFLYTTYGHCDQLMNQLMSIILLNSCLSL